MKKDQDLAETADPLDTRGGCMPNLQKTISERDCQSGKPSQRGYVLVEALLVCVGIGFLAVASISLQETLTRSQFKVSIHSQLSEMRRMVVENLNNPGVWDQIVQNPKNGIKQCLSDSTESCDYSGLKSIELEVSAANKLFIDPRNPEVGFGMSLEGCDTFEVKDQSATSCPFQARMVWQPICTVGGDCKQILVSVSFKADPRYEELYSFSANTYSFIIKRNLDLKRSESVPGSRTQSFKADASAPKSVKVFLIVDNSVSMADNRDTLATGLESFVDGMKGYEVQYYVYTTESALMAAWNRYPKTDAEISATSAIRWGDGAFTLPDGSKLKGRFDWVTVPGQKFNRWDGQIELAQDLGAKWNLGLTQKATDTDLTAIKTKLVKLMKDVENKDASSEAGICTMAHILNAKGPYNPIAPGDSAVFLTLSDEDDVGYTSSAPDHWTICADKISVRPNDPLGQSRNNCWLGPNPNLCDEIRIGLATPEKYWRTAYFQYRNKDSYMDNIADLCESHTPGACGVLGSVTTCTRADIPWPDPTDGWTWNNSCEMRVRSTEESADFYLQKAKLDGGSFTAWKDYCTQSFNYDGTVYTDLYDFGRRFLKMKDSDFHSTPTCWFEGAQLEPAHETHFTVMNSTIEPNNRLWDADDFQKPMDALYNSIPGRLRELFGKDGYALYSVVHDKGRDDLAGCALDPLSGSYGSKYKQLLLASDTPGNLISVCQANYSASLEDMRTQAQQIARDTYVLDPFDPLIERVYSIQVQRNGKPLILTKSDYGISGVNVKFKAGFIQGNDQIQVVIVPK